MKRIVFTLFIFTFSFIFSVFFFACKKEHIDSETQSSSDYSICEGEFTKIAETIIGYTRIAPGIIKGNSKNHPTVIFPDTVSHPGWPRRLVIDYDSVVVDSADGKIRKGKVICEFSNHWKKKGARIKITLQNYVINKGAVTVDSIVFIQRTNELTEMHVYDGKYSTKEWSVNWACKRSFTQLEGIKTPNFNDDVFRFSGNSTATTRAGKKIAATIMLPLIKHASCKWIDAGKIDFTMEEAVTHTIDFGNSTCDNVAKLTVNGNTLNFSLD